MNRFTYRERYIEGWYELDAQKLLSACSDNFIFDDPYESSPVARDGLIAYMSRWNHRIKAAGSNNEWKLDYEVRQDKDGVITDWEWWELVGTDLQGSALVVTSDEGVLLERITYFNRPPHNR